jgi:hypothetical protein
MGSDRHFVLVDRIESPPEDAAPSALPALRDAIRRGERIEKVSGYVEGWSGRWPEVLSNPPARAPRLMVTEFSLASNSTSETQK